MIARVRRGRSEGYISSRKAEVCEKVAAELSNGGECIALPADLSSEQACRDLAAEVTGRTGGELDILVNNAGATWGAPLDEFDDAAWDRTLNLNVKGVFHLTKFLRPALEASFAHRDDPARVINIGSIDGLRTPVLETTRTRQQSRRALHPSHGKRRPQGAGQRGRPGRSIEDDGAT